MTAIPVHVKHAGQGRSLHRRGLDVRALIAYAQECSGRGWSCPRIKRAIQGRFKAALSVSIVERLVNGEYPVEPPRQNERDNGPAIAQQLAKLDAEVARQTRESEAAAERLGWHCQAGCFPRNYGSVCTNCGRPR